jgi:hypothetical protein
MYLKQTIKAPYNFLEMDPNVKDIDIFVDTDGTVIMLTWAMLSYTMAMCLHPRALDRGNLLGAMGRDIIRMITRVAYRTSIQDNYHRLFQVFGRRMTQRLEGQVYYRRMMNLQIRPESITMVNHKHEMELRVIFNADNEALTVTMTRGFIRYFVSSTGARLGNTYHAINGGEFGGMELVETDLGAYYSKLIMFPSDIDTLCRLMEAAVPDLSRTEAHLKPESFPVVARDMQTKYTKLGISVKISRKGGAYFKNENKIELLGSNFRVFVEYNGGIFKTTLSPADAFAQHMMAGRVGYNLQHGTHIFKGFKKGVNKKIQSFQTGLGSWYEAETTCGGIGLGGGFRRLIDTAMAAGGVGSVEMSPQTIAGSLNPNLGARTITGSPNCPHCGAEMGEGGMSGAACAACRRLGLD